MSEQRVIDGLKKGQNVHKKGLSRRLISRASVIDGLLIQQGKCPITALYWARNKTLTTIVISVQKIVHKIVQRWT